MASFSYRQVQGVVGITFARLHFRQCLISARHGATMNTAIRETPQNGIPGLKNLRHDILSGVVVSLVSLPLSSGIAIASGVPPVYGLISAIIAGLVFPFIGGAFVTISG